METSKQIIVLATVEGFVSERLAYTIAFINAHPLKPQSIDIVLSEDDTDSKGLVLRYGEKEIIPAQKYFFLKEVPEHAYYINRYQTKDTHVCSVETKQCENDVFFKEGAFSFDIFETIFFHISRYEEVHAHASDINQAGWLKETEHILIQYKIQDIPVVDHLVRAFFNEVLQEHIDISSTYSLSHDIDILTRFQPAFKFYRSLLATMFYRRGIQQLNESIRYYKEMKSKNLPDPYYNFEALLSQELNVVSRVIYFMVGGNSKYDNKYKITDEKVDEIASLARNNAYQIGLHTSYNTMFDIDRFRSEKKRLENRLDIQVRHNRQHWLRWDWDKTPFILEELSIETDSSMGYNSHLGFRCGTGFPYKMYNFIKEARFSWTELPMSFMESSAIHNSKLAHNDIEEIMVDFIQKNKNNTHVEMNFHNSNFDPTLESGKKIHAFYFMQLKELIG